MPRGRHRQSAPLHKLLPPLSVAAASIVSATGALVVGETAVVRGLAVAAGAAAVVGAVLMRAWDRAAGKRVAELTKERTREEWRTEERIAELETEVEEGRELREALNTRLRAKRSELARLRNEHAELLRRYATAETERARALEAGRVLAISTSGPETSGGAEPAAPVPGASGAETPAVGSYGLLDPEVFRRAAAALSRLAGEDGPTGSAEAAGAAPGAGGESPAGGGPVTGGEAEPDAGRAVSRAQVPEASRGGSREGLMHGRNAASAVVPYAAARRAAARAEGTFDFFGTQKRPQLATRQPEPELEPQALPAEEDLADVVGAEALAEQAKQRAGGEVIDLTAHDETEQIDVAELRSAIS
ncbi:hypothetical protein ACZ90_27255 [Streptomyces albus subsp. albus]|nr:hypothetical protein ACZ90_27255 [Streptomyces albus subsp. albus]